MMTSLIARMMGGSTASATMVATLRGLSQRCQPLITEFASLSSQRGITVAADPAVNLAPRPAVTDTDLEVEDRRIAEAIAKIRESQGHANTQFHIVVEVMRASDVGVALALNPLREDFASVPEGGVRPALLRILTGADYLSDEALRHQMYRAEKDAAGQDVPVIAVNVADALTLRRQKMRYLLHVFRGVITRVYEDKRDKLYRGLVCGFGNAGKSSVILGLCKDKGQRGPDLPQVGPDAGTTQSMRHYKVPLIPTKYRITKAGDPMRKKKQSIKNKKKAGKINFADVPGLRPPITDLAHEDAAHLIAGGAAAASPVALEADPALQEAVVAAMRRGLERHTALSQGRRGRATCDIPQDLIGGVRLAEAVKTFRQGAYGPYVLEREGDGGAPPPASFLSLRNDRQKSSIMAMNRLAKGLRRWGEGRITKEEELQEILDFPDDKDLDSHRVPK